MKADNHILTDYNLNVISINQLIYGTIERTIKVYCLKIDYTLNPKSRDTKRLILHYIADTVLHTLCKFDNVKNILHFTDIKSLNLLPDELTVTFNSAVRKLVKQFKLCTLFTDYEIVNYTVDEIYQLKQLSDLCKIKDSNLSKIKKFLSDNEFTHLSNKLSLDFKVKCAIMKV